MRICFLVCSIVLLASMDFVSADDSSMKANMPAQAQTVKGATKETLLPARWPQFVEKDISWNAECGKYIAKENVDQTEGTVATGGLSLAPIYLRSSYAPDVKAGDKAVYTDLKGLRFEEYAIPEEYRKTAKIIVSWTMQVLGESPSDSEQDPDLPSLVCPGMPTGETHYIPHYKGPATTAVKYVLHRKFPGGFQVNSQLVATDGGTKVVKGPFSLSMPEGRDKESTKIVVDTYINIDPTLTGTVILEPADFGGSLPNKVTLQVQWINDTPLTVYTPGDSRQMTVTIVPLNAQAS